MDRYHSEGPSFCPGDGTGIRVGLRSQILGVRLSSGAPSVFSKMDITSGYGPLSGGSIPSGPAKVYGSVDEWFKSAVLKTADSKGSVSSNLTASANYRSEFATQRKRQRRRDKQGESCAE